MSVLKSSLALTLVFVVACGGDDGGGAVPASAGNAIENYSSIVHASYEDSLAAAAELDAALQVLLAAPSQATLDAARNAWLAAREPYLQTEVYRFYDGPIDNPDDGPEGLINAWPLDEAYIDYVDGDATAGIINNAGVPIDETSLKSLNEHGGEANIATGYHAIEFLLWGQDQSADGPGNRPHTDFVTEGGGTAANQARRVLYLQTASKLLLDHLGQVVEAWAPGGANYRAELEAAKPKEALRRILTGMIVLTGFETGGERLQTALDSGDQEDEHSCFSDNTHRDMIQDIQGIHNVWHGSYRRLDDTTVSGLGIRDVVAQVAPELASAIDEQIARCLGLANALQPPFDQEIRAGNPEGRGRVQALVIALQDLEGQFEEVFRTFELEIPEPE
jgi:putative iron-regulated protein